MSGVRPVKGFPLTRKQVASLSQVVNAADPKVDVWNVYASVKMFSGSVDLARVVEYAARLNLPLPVSDPKEVDHLRGVVFYQWTEKRQKEYLAGKAKAALPTAADWAIARAYMRSLRIAILKSEIEVRSLKIQLIESANTPEAPAEPG